MKIYICYTATDYEGCSFPEAAFKTEEGAKEYCKRMTKENSRYLGSMTTYEISEIELEE